MNTPVLGTAAAVLGANVLFFVGATVILGFYGWKSYRRRRTEPMLLLTLAMTFLTWMEAPYDWGMFVTYHPDFPRIPGWGAAELAGLSDKGPFGLTHAGLPWMAIPGYPFYWVVPLVFSVGLAKWLTRRYGFVYPRALLMAGLATGFAWDLFWNIVGTRVGVWRIAHVPWGLGVFQGSKYQITLGTSLTSGIFVMGCAYLFGRVDDRGDDLLRQWARRRASRSRKLNLLHLGATVLYVHLLYALMMFPHLATNAWGLTTNAAREPLFAGMQNQWTPPVHDGPLGFALIVGATVVYVLVALFLVNRYDPLISRMQLGAQGPRGSKRDRQFQPA